MRRPRSSEAALCSLKLHCWSPQLQTRLQTILDPFGIPPVRTGTRWLLDRPGERFVTRNITDGRPYAHLVRPHIQSDEYRQACPDDKAILYLICTVSRISLYNMALILLSRNRCRDRRPHLNDATPYLVWKFDPVWDCQRGFFHQRRECRTKGRHQFVETVISHRTTRRDD